MIFKNNLVSVKKMSKWLNEKGLLKRILAMYPNEEVKYITHASGKRVDALIDPYTVWSYLTRVNKNRYYTDLIRVIDRKLGHCKTFEETLEVSPKSTDANIYFLTKWLMNKGLSFKYAAFLVNRTEQELSLAINEVSQRRCLELLAYIENDYYMYIVDDILNEID